jgi:prophage endopeptidase
VIAALKLIPLWVWGLLALTLALCMGSFALAWRWQANSYGKVIATNEANRQAELTSIANASAEQLRRSLVRQKAAELSVAAIDAQLTKEKSDGLAENETLRRKYTGALADNDRLRGDVRAGYDRLRIAGACHASPANVSKATSAVGLDDGGTIELAPEAGQTVFDIRAGIITDQAALRGLQKYVREVCQ